MALWKTHFACFLISSPFIVSEKIQDIVWIIAGENISTIIKVDPFNIYERPEIKFLGPERATEQYNTHLNDNLANWQPQENTFQALLELLGKRS